MITVEILNKWLSMPTESETLEFKEAKTQFDQTKLLKYCAAISNEGGGCLVLGVTDKHPRKVVGSKAFVSKGALNSIKKDVVHELSIRVDVAEVAHPDGRVLVFDVPARQQGCCIEYKGAFWMRAGESLVPMTQDMLKRIFDEGKPDWLSRSAKSNVSSDEVVALLDTQAYFDLLKLPYPTSRDGVLERFVDEGLIKKTAKGWRITNLAAIVLAKKLSDFPEEILRKSPRFIIYAGINKLRTKDEIIFDKGYAVGFDELVGFVHTSAPQNKYLEEAVREEVKMFPKQALRELIANALIHQDFLASGSTVMIEMYDDRVEISNPGKPPIRIERFIDENKSRNEKLASFMRRLGICEEKGSGIDKVVSTVEMFQLPAPDFREGDIRTTAILFAHQDFTDMKKSDRLRACYQHCVLMYLSNKGMSNQSLCERFGVTASKKATISTIIGEAKKKKLIKPDESETLSTRYARYLPFWA